MLEPALEGRLDQIVRRRDELRDALAAGTLAGPDFAKLSKEYSDLEPVIESIEALASLKPPIPVSEMSSTSKRQPRNPA